MGSVRPACRLANKTYPNLMFLLQILLEPTRSTHNHPEVPRSTQKCSEVAKGTYNVKKTCKIMKKHRNLWENLENHEIQGFRKKNLVFQGVNL